MSYKSFLFVLATLLTAHFSHAESSSAASTQPSYHLTGNATLASNFVEKGLTQTQGDPGLQSEFWFNFGSQFRMGLWGANVRYETAETSHFWLRANADVKVDFSQNAKMNIVYNENKYYKANKRDGNTIGVHFDFSGWRIIYDMNSNWEGTRAKETYAGVGKDFPVWTNWVWSSDGGYTMPQAAGVSSFFDIRTGLGIKFKDFTTMGSISYTTATGEFKKQGEAAAFVTINVAF
jgi:uncharacterized protein (TIGR02001 family)